MDFHDFRGEKNDYVNIGKHLFIIQNGGFHSTLV